MQFQFRLVLGFWISLGLGFAACAPATPELQLEQAVEGLASGQLIQAISKNHVATSKALARIASSQLPDATHPFRNLEDPCPQVARPAKTASKEAMAEAMKDLAVCFEGLYLRADRAQAAMNFFKTFDMDLGEEPLSQMSDEGLQKFLSKRPASLQSLMAKPSEWNTRFRIKYSEEDLDELWILVGKRNLAFQELEAQVFAAMDARPHLIQAFSHLDRYKALLVLRETAEDTVGTTTQKKLLQVLDDKFEVPAGAMNELLHPFALPAMLPSPGSETSALGALESPYLFVSIAQQELGGSTERIKSIINLYSELREMDHAEMPDHPPAAADAVRVALIDTGIDFLKYPDLALFAGRGKEGELSQADFGDGDKNPWIPAMGGLNHGTGTMATLLTFLARFDRDLLRERKVDVAMWKTASLRSVLMGEPYTPLERFDPMVIYNSIDALVKSIEGEGVKPKIVSFSSVLKPTEWLEKIGKPDLLKRSPWLWVMAAGNTGVTLDAKNGGCFQDVKAENRPDARILCVGALTQGIINDTITYYSATGPRVDVYAYESYHKLCPSGTSCSTPVVASAAVVIASRYPQATPEQIREIILDASEIRTLEVDNRPGELDLGLGKDQMKVRVFDPETMMDRALRVADERFTPKAPADSLKKDKAGPSTPGDKKSENCLPWWPFQAWPRCAN